MRVTDTTKYRNWRGWIWLPVLISLGLSAILFRGAGELYWGPIESDLINSFYPYHVFIHRWLMRGIIPWWDPHVFSGYPTLETQQMLALNPIHLVSLLMPAPWGLPFQMAAHTVIAAGSLGWALWRWGRVCAAAAAAGACVWAFGGLFGVRVAAGHFTVVAAIAWWPLALLGVMRLARTGWRRAGRGLIFWTVVAHAMAILAGGPQYVAYLFYMDVAVALAAMRRNGAVSVGISGAGVWVMAMLITAPQWLPAFWYLPYSSRASGGGDALSRLNWGPLWNLWLEGVMPYPFGDDLTSGHLHFKNVWETAAYPGTLAWVFLLALAMLVGRWIVRRIRKKGSGFRGIGAISPLGLAGLALVVLGFYMMVGGWLPGFASFREATKARAVCAIGMALTAAAGLNALLRRPVQFGGYMWVGALLQGAALAGVYRFTEPGALRELLKGFGPPFDPNVSAEYNAMLMNPGPAAVRYSMALAVSLGLVGLTLLVLGIRRRYPLAALVVLMGIVSLDPLAAHLRNWEARHPWGAVGLPVELGDYFGPRLAEGGEDGSMLWRAVLPAQVINRTHHLEGLYEYHGYDPLMPAGAVGRIFVPGIRDLPESERVAGRVQAQRAAGIRFDASKTKDGDGAGTSGMAIVELGSAGLFEITRKVKVERLEVGLNGPDMNGVSVLDAPLTVAIKETSGSDVVRMGDSGPNRWGVMANAVSPGLLLWKTTWLPGWQVQVDEGEWRPALRVNGWMCGVEVPGGKHEVVFRYAPVGLKQSVALSICGFALFLWAVLIAGKGGRKVIN